MRRQWLLPTRVVTGQARCTSWNQDRLLAVGMMMTSLALVLALGLAEITAADGSFAAVSAAGIDGPISTPIDIGEAAAAVRTGPFEPAGVEHLTIVRLSVNVCGGRSSGTGVLIAEGLIVTAAHVVGDAGLVRVDHGNTTVSGEVLGVLADGRDIALVSVDAPMDAPLAPRPVPDIGQPVTMVGYPEGGLRATAVGPRVEVSATVAAVLAGAAFGVDAAVTVGFSGGPAVDAGGNLVGIVVAGETTTGTALITPLADIQNLDETAVVDGACPTDA